MNFIQLKRARKHCLRALFVCIIFLFALFGIMAMSLIEKVKETFKKKYVNIFPKSNCCLNN